MIERPMTGYNRDLFGQPWRDTDHTGCDQRSDVLARDGEEVRDVKRPCKIVAITLVDAYTGETLTSTGSIQIDHVVPLAAAWRAGAADWTTQRREQFATDMDNLLPTRGTVNQAKSDRTPDTWRPPNPAAYCRYATVYITISDRYHLGVTVAVRGALAELMEACPQ
jgi:Protein of unknown function (DUF1524)